MSSEERAGGEQKARFLMFCETDWGSSGEEENQLDEDTLRTKDEDTQNPCRTDTNKTKHTKDSRRNDVILVEDKGVTSTTVKSKNIAEKENRHGQNRSKSSKYECLICLKTFSGIEQWFQHKHMHDNQDLASCQICTTGFEKPPELVRHKEKHSQYSCKEGKLGEIIESIDTRVESPQSFILEHGRGQFPCGKCRHTFETKESLKKHLVKHTDKSMVCVLCEQKFSHSIRLMKHITQEHKNGKPYACVYCQTDFPGLVDLKAHLTTHRDEIDMFCRACNRQFPYRSDYNRHVLWHKKSKEFFECSLCCERYKTKEGLEKHFKLHEGLSPGTCVFCKSVFSDKESLKSHIQSEHHQHACHICKKKFDRKSFLRLHLEKHKADEIEAQEITCPICLTDFGSPSNLKRHMASHNSKSTTPSESLYNEKEEGDDLADRPTKSRRKSKNQEKDDAPKTISCSECKEVFTTKRDYERHVKGQHPSYCAQCDETFPDQRSLSFHLKEVHIAENLPIDKETFLCTVCDSTFFTKKGFKNHMHEHTGERKRHTCYICDRGMNSASLLEEHMRRHRGEKPFMCDQCAKQFTTSSGLKIHLQCHSNDRPHICPICDKGFGRAGSLRIHMSVHDGARPFGCTLCSKSFNNQHNLEEHLHMHSGSKPFICNVCQKQFALHQYLKQHEKIHESVRKHACRDCDKKFATPQGLYQHSKTHRDRPYACGTCGRRFTHMQTLRLHQQRHSGELERKHKCQVCDKCFSSPQSLYQHTRTHKDKAYTCDECGASFSKIRALKEHIYTHTVPKTKSKRSGKRGSLSSNPGLAEADGKSLLEIAMEQGNIRDEHYGEPSYITSSECNNQLINQVLAASQEIKSEETRSNCIILDTSSAKTNYKTAKAMDNSISNGENVASDEETTVYYEPEAGFLFSEHPELIGDIAKDPNVQASLSEIKQDFSKQIQLQAAEFACAELQRKRLSTAGYTSSIPSKDAPLLKSEPTSIEDLMAGVHNRAGESPKTNLHEQDASYVAERIYASAGDTICHKVKKIDPNDGAVAGVSHTLPLNTNFPNYTSTESAYSPQPGVIHSSIGKQPIQPPPYASPYTASRYDSSYSVSYREPATRYNYQLPLDNTSTLHIRESLHPIISSNTLPQSSNHTPTLSPHIFDSQTRNILNADNRNALDLRAKPYPVSSNNQPVSRSANQIYSTMPPGYFHRLHSHLSESLFEQPTRSFAMPQGQFQMQSNRGFEIDTSDSTLDGDNEWVEVSDFNCY